jgi:stage II sporulation protein P
MNPFCHIIAKRGIHMKKRFIAKRTKRKFGVKLITFFSLVLFFFFSTFHYGVKNLKDHMTNEEIVNLLFKNGMGNHEFFDFLKMNPTEFLFSTTMGIHLPKSETVWQEEEEAGFVYDYVPDPSPSSDAENPLIYIYNTHQTEGYSKAGISEYDIVPTVLFASYYLREKLNDLSLPTLVETNEMAEILRINQWSYSHSYEASRYLILETKKQHPSIKYFIDIHRDAISYESSTTEQNGKKYAKVLFVIGKEHENFNKNLQLATALNEKLKLKVNNITRGVIGKEGKNVNGIYNQDISPNSLLIEIGGQYNNITEVTNTMELLAKVLKEYIEENEG